MVFLKACPKCHGDMYLERDSYGPFRQCLQCGKIEDAVAAAKAVALGRAASPAAAASRKRISARGSKQAA